MGKLVVGKVKFDGREFSVSRRDMLEACKVFDLETCEVGNLAKLADQNDSLNADLIKANEHNSKLRRQLARTSSINEDLIRAKKAPRGKTTMVNHPTHYNMGSVEVIDAIEAWKLNFALGSVVKYIARHAHKAEPIEDLEKALWYLTDTIRRMGGGEPDGHPLEALRAKMAALCDAKTDTGYRRAMGEAIELVDDLITGEKS